MDMSLTPGGWRTRYVATSLCTFDRTDSTQTEARRLIAGGHGSGALVLAAEQTAGRGRFSREWHSPPGNLYLSFVLRPSRPVAEWPAVMMAASLALVELLDALGIAKVGIKWPNDVLIGGRKVAGMLAEVDGTFLILGIGLNVNADPPADLPQATSICAALGRTVDAAALLRAFVEAVDEYYGQLEAGLSLRDRWAARIVTLGQMVHIRAGDELIEGVAETVEPDGALVVRCPDGTPVTCHAGEVTLST
ncbi:MAG: biotin--[acetyl-CoA-carboxylase] ligase [Chloroflexi bacterium]|nr:biotin--[acetyl-CoA-carboxylase] ligase [Chloroflexota bacterium]